MVDRKIEVSKLTLINKWTKGALARRRLQKIIITKRIQNLKYPTYENQELKFTDETLFTDKELYLMMDYNRGSRNLVWNNHYIILDKKKLY